MTRAATNSTLVDTFKLHIEETQEHIERLYKVSESDAGIQENLTR